MSIHVNTATEEMIERFHSKCSDAVKMSWIG